MKKKRLITSALPYVNNAPHLGNIIGAVLSADVYARYCRSVGHETLYICGTDGYGTATETKAKEENTTPEEICNRYHKIHEQIYKDFNISFDSFGKTFQPGHSETVQKMFTDVSSNGYVLEQNSEQYWCGSCDKFLADRLVKGECPSCNYEDAKGDQCDSCGKLLNPTDLIKPQCSVCSSTPVIKSAKHLYLDLPQLNDQLVTWHNSSIKNGKWTKNAITTTQSWVERGLNPRPITRDLKWGVPVPQDGYRDKVFYVWFDAPIGYISITQKHLPDTWQDWWLNPEKVELYQFMGKDNIPFHSVIFPATQIASKQNWTMAHQINSTEYLNYEDEKFSKSRNVGVFGTDVAEIGFPIDLWRYYLLRIRPERHDSAFLWEDFFDRVNNELIDNVCNLVNRLLVYNKKNFDGPFAEAQYQESHKLLIKEVKELESKYLDQMEIGEMRDSLDVAMQIGKLGNKFFQDQEPWKKIKVDKDQVQTTLICLIHLIRDVALMLSPFVPETANKILAMVGTPDATLNDLGDYSSLTGVEQTDVQILHQKLDTKLVQSFKEDFGDKNKVGFEDLNIQVGEVISCEKAADSKTLLIEKIKIGNGKTIQVVSGLAQYYEPEDLINRKVIVLVNLEPAEIRGTRSEGMLLVAATRKKMELLNFDESASQIGDRATLAGKQAKDNLPNVSFEDFSKIKLNLEKNKAFCSNKEIHLNGSQIKTKEIESGKIK
jgi:methionyl-tRNA synthetase